MAKKKIEFPEVIYMEYPSRFGNWTERKPEDLAGKSGSPVGVYRLEQTMKIKRVRHMVEQSVVELE